MLISIEQTIFNLQQIHIVPVYPNQKRPMTRHGYKDGKTNADIKSLLGKGYNVGISLSLSGLGCIDVDMHGKSDGLAEFKKLCEQLGYIDSYTEVTATGNGLHIVLQDDGIIAGNCEIAPGVEFKRNGIIVCAPSQINGVQYKIKSGINPDGTYKFAKLSPEWLAIINNASKSTPKKAYNSVNVSYKAKVFGNLDYSKVFKSCQFLQHVKNNSCEILEPMWFTAVNMLSADINSDKIIHWISADHPTYSFEETQKKIEYSRTKGLFCGCNYIVKNYHEICKGCPKAEEIIRGEI